MTKNGSRGGIRTPDRVVNSHLLCQLSYPGTDFFIPNNLAPGEKSSTPIAQGG